ncbi:MAG: outer membrane beta-barrel protein [Bacteriovoracaceae bacterium]|nr:outer membrane beta-barrel protein [Bacteriovoracaceae bacterium]
MKKIIITTISLLLSTATIAATGSFSNGLVRVEPVVGYEREQKFKPTPHTKDRMFYGARLLFGPPLISIEGEYLQSEDTETFPTDNLNIKTKTEKFKAGIRSGLRLGPFLSWYLRGGYQGSKRNTETTNTTTDVTVTKNSAFKVAPYAGTGMRIHLMGAFSIAGDFTVVFTDDPEKGDREYQTSLGLNLRI